MCATHWPERWCGLGADGPIIAKGNLVLPSNGTMPFLGADISPLDLQMERVDTGILRVKIGAPGRWELPQDKMFINTVKGTSPSCMSTSFILLLVVHS